MKPTGRITTRRASSLHGPNRGLATGLGATVDKWIHWDFTQVDQKTYDKMKDATIPEGEFTSTLPPPDKVTGVVADATAAYMRQNQISHTVKSRTLQWSALGETATVEDKWIKVPQMNQQVFERVLQAVEPKVKQAIKNQTEIGTIPSDFDEIGLQTPLQDLADLFWDWWLDGINKSNTKLPAKASGFDRGIQRYLMIEVDSWGESSGGNGGGSSLVRVRIETTTQPAARALKRQFVRSSGGQIVRTEGQTTIIADLPADSLSAFRDFNGVKSLTELGQNGGTGGGGSGNGGGGPITVGGGGQQAQIIPGVSNPAVVIGGATLLSVALVAAAS